MMMTRNEMLEELCMYYEAAGFDEGILDELSVKTDSELQDMLDDIYC